MAHKTQESIRKLEQEILAELGEKHAIITPWQGIPFSISITRLMNGLRKWQSRFFKPIAIRTTITGNKQLLTPEEAMVSDKFDSSRSEFRALNYHYSDQYRGGYMLNYNFAVVAIALAVLSIWLLYIGEKILIGEHDVSIIIFWMGLVKFILLFIILINTRQANGIEFNHRAICVRYAMEQFRCMRYLSLLNIRRLPDIPETKYLSKKWKNNYLDVFVRREIRAIFSCIDQKNSKSNNIIDFNERLPYLIEFIQADWIKQQIDYHEQKKKTQEALYEKIEKLVNCFNLVVLIAVGADLLIVGACFIGLLPEYFERYFHIYGSSSVFVSAAIIPAIVASYNGIKFQTESRKMAERSASMLELLSNLDCKYDDLKNILKNQKNRSDNLGSYTAEAISLVNDTASIMIQEVTEWSFIYAGDVHD